MPSRKSRSGGGQGEGRSPLRRLSSIASLHNLNPFSRRRSNATTDSTVSNSTNASSSSNLSISSTAANPPQHTPATTTLSTGSHKQTDEDDGAIDITALSVPLVPPVPVSTSARRGSSYICLPDDPIGGMPRSRTFSNLPLPSRARRATPMTASQSHYRLPSTLLPSTRLPSPPVSTRKHSTSRLWSTGPQEPSVQRNRIVRSDTMPSMAANTNQVRKSGRSTAFKENITLSPVKQLPPMNIFDAQHSGFPSRMYPHRHDRMDHSDNGEDFQPLLHGPDFCPAGSSTRFSRYAELSGAETYASSPAYRSSRLRQPTPSTSKPDRLERWNSQPILSNVTNRQPSQHGEIKQRRLMSQVQPLVPPKDLVLKTGKLTRSSDVDNGLVISSQTSSASVSRPSTPPNGSAFTRGNSKRLNNSGPLRVVPEQSPSASRLANDVAAPLIQRGRSTSEVTIGEPPAYWCGRVAALTDRYRNEDLALHLAKDKTLRNSSLHLSTPRRESDKMHTPEANVQRLRRALDQLYALCTTLEAKRSFLVFERRFADMQGLPDLARSNVLSVLDEVEDLVAAKSTEGREAEIETEEGRALTSEDRKASFINRLLGRGRRGLRVDA